MEFANIIHFACFCVILLLAVACFVAGFWNPFHFGSSAICALLARVIYKEKHW